MSPESEERLRGENSDLAVVDSTVDLTFEFRGDLRYLTACPRPFRRAISRRATAAARSLSADCLKRLARASRRYAIWISEVTCDDPDVAVAVVFVISVAASADTRKSIRALPERSAHAVVPRGSASVGDPRAGLGHSECEAVSRSMRIVKCFALIADHLSRRGLPVDRVAGAAFPERIDV